MKRPIRCCGAVLVELAYGILAQRYPAACLAKSPSRRIPAVAFPHWHWATASPFRATREQVENVGTTRTPVGVLSMYAAGRETAVCFDPHAHRGTFSKVRRIKGIFWFRKARKATASTRQNGVGYRPDQNLLAQRVLCVLCNTMCSMADATPCRLCGVSDLSCIASTPREGYPSCGDLVPEAVAFPPNLRFLHPREGNEEKDVDDLSGKGAV